MPIELTDEMSENVNGARVNNKACLFGTASADGWPSIGYRGSMMVFDKDHLAYWERSRRDGLAHIQENPKVLVWYRDPENRAAAWKFYGHVIIHEDGDIREQVWERVVDVEKTPDPEKKGLAVLIEVDYVETFSGQKLQEREK